jgi:hypothetical protein
MAATGTHATVEELLEAMFSVLSVPGLYNEDQLPHTQNLYLSNHFLAKENDSNNNSNVRYRYSQLQTVEFLLRYDSILDLLPQAQHPNSEVHFIVSL